MASKKKVLVPTKLIGFLLDKTGSMAARRDETIVAFNEYIAGLKRDQPDSLFSMTLFSAGEVDHRYEKESVLVLGDLTTANYKCTGSTNLFDAIADLVGRMAAQASSIKGSVEVLIVILSDGQENASRHTTRAQVQDLITAKQNAGWGFVYMGADIDSYTPDQVEETFAIPKDMSMQYDAGKQSSQAFGRMNSATNAYFGGKKRGLFAGKDKA